MLSNRGRIANSVAGLRTAYLVTDPAGLFYLTGTSIEGFYLLLLPKGGVIFTSPMLAEQLRVLIPEVPVMADNKVLDLIVRYYRKNNIKSISVDPAKISFAFARKLSEKVTVEVGGDILSGMRMVKDAEEIAAMREAGRIAAGVVERIHSLLKPGLTEDNISFKIEEYFAKSNVRSSFLPIVASGPNSSKPHHLSSSRRLEANDMVTIDLGCVYRGYCSDLTRTFFLGKMNHLKKRVFSIVEKAKLQAARAVRPGVTAGYIDAVARTVISRAGYGDAFIHTTGHGVGIEVHEAPRLGKRDKTILKPGMVVTVEPGIYLSGQFGIRLEDTLLVTEKGSEVLTV